MTHDPALSVSDLIRAALDDAIRIAGSQSQLARDLRIKPAQVSKWLRDGRVPLGRVPAVSRLTGVPRHRLRPDLPEFFPPPSDAAPCPQRTECTG